MLTSRFTSRRRSYSRDESSLDVAHRGSWAQPRRSLRVAPLSASDEQPARMGDVAPSNRKIVTNSGLLRLPRHIAAPGPGEPEILVDWTTGARVP
jgi:hypothetical protein